jgi:hypothetical protein
MGLPQPSREPRNFKRTIVLAASRNQEIRLLVPAMGEIVGFPAGLDEGSVEVVATDTQRQVWIMRVHIARVQTTGRTLTSIARTGALSRAEIEVLRKKTKNFTHVARRFLEP